MPNSLYFLTPSTPPPDRTSRSIHSNAVTKSAAIQIVGSKTWIFYPPEAYLGDSYIFGNIIFTLYFFLHTFIWKARTISTANQPSIHTIPRARPANRTTTTCIHLCLGIFCSSPKTGATPCTATLGQIICSRSGNGRNYSHWSSMTIFSFGTCSIFILEKNK